MRETHFCTTCEFRLPYCVRSDRRYCGSRCRVWWNLHPGVKRLDFAPGEARLPRRGRRGKPKTMAEALVALAESRQYAAQLERELQRQQLRVQRQRKGADEATHSATALHAHYQRQKDALRDELDAIRLELSESKTKHQESSTTEGELRTAIESLQQQIEQAEESYEQLQKERDQLVAEQAAKRKEWEEKESRQTDEIELQRQKLAAADEALLAVHEVVDSQTKTIELEKEQRAAIEKRVEQLGAEIERIAKDGVPESGRNAQSSLFESWDRHLSAELQETRLSRDAAVAQRERYARRILRIMSPGQYLEHAMAAGYDLTRDPLIQLKRSEVLVEGQLAEKQKIEQPNGRARELDTEQTFDEQAYAAALSFRWQHINRPHRERRGKIKWVVVGFQLDTESEEYLRKLTRTRIRRLERQIAER